MNPELPHPWSSLSTAEMLAALPPGLLHSTGAAGDRRVGELLALYRAVFVNSTDAVAIFDTTGRYLEQNVAHEALLGYSAADLAGQSAAVHIGEETFASVIQDLVTVGACRREIECRTRDGRDLVVELSAFSVRDRRGEPVCFVGIKRDVTEQRRAAAQLARQFAELQAVYRIAESLSRAREPEEIFEEAIDALLGVFQAQRAAVLLCDTDGVMRFRAWRGLSYGYRAAVEGHSPWKHDEPNPLPIAIDDALADPALSALRDVIEAESIGSLAFIPLHDESRLLGKLMIYFDAPHSWTGSELKLAGAIARHVAFAIVRHRRESELKEANRAKSIFLATMSHELRTPLNAIAGYTDLLEAGVHGALNPSQTDAMARIQVNQRHLLRLIDDVLDFAKLEAGHLRFEIASVPVQETLRSTCALIEPQLAARKVRFEFVPGDPTVTCRGDGTKVRQVISNLLSNACKFTPPGGMVRLDFEATPDAVHMRVQDTGPGIPPSDVAAAFEPFVQLQAGFRRRAEGTGLGLAISRELALGMGGEVTAASEPGKGSTFTLTLPRG